MWILLWILLLPALLFLAVFLCSAIKRSGRRSGCIIVLGAKVHPDGSMCRSLRWRCDAAVSAWQRGISEWIILCGGVTGGASRSEASAMAEYIRGLGVPDSAVILEDRSRNTVENFRNAREIMRERGFADAAVVTSDYHVQRALWIARKFSIRACGISARSPRKLYYRMKNLLRECVSWVVFWWYELRTAIGGFQPPNP